MREPTITRAAAAAAVVLAALGGEASARTIRTTGYRYEQVFSATVRHLRIEEGYAILEKDPDAGYVLFELADDGKKFRGSLEVVRYQEGDRPMVRLILHIEDRPAYMEAAVLERILAKLHDELGDEPPPPAAPEPPAQKRPAPRKGQASGSPSQ